MPVIWPTEGDEKDFRERCHTCDETTLFLIISNLGGYVWSINHALKRNQILDSVELRTEMYGVFRKVEIACSYLYRFGIARHRDENGSLTSAYREWFNWWSTFITGLPDWEFERIKYSFQHKADLSAWRPMGTWRNEEDSEQALA